MGTEVGATPARWSWFSGVGRFRAGALLVICVVFGLAFSWSDDLIWWLRSGTPLTQHGLRYGLLFGTYHALTAWAMHTFLRLREDRRGNRWQIIAGVLICFLFFVVLRWVGDQTLLPVLGTEPNYPSHTPFLSFALDNITYALLPIGFGTLLHLLESQFVAMRRQLELSHHQRLSELDMLRARIAPHFLFNTLNNLYALAQRPGADLSEPIHHLAELMRYVSKNERTMVPLREEREQLARYLALQALRFSKPVQVVIDIDDRLDNTVVPAMLLLPLVENAFKHGDPCDERVPLRLSVRVEGDRLHVSCVNKIGDHAPEDGVPTGNHNLARRLHLLYGSSAHTSFIARGAGTFVADLAFPRDASLGSDELPGR
jgi:two-component system, LytTR family, sensor kinase